MHEKRDKPQALFLFSNGRLISDDLVCSGERTDQFEGACDYARDGRMPGLMRLEVELARSASRLGRAGELCPICALEQLGSLENWQAVIGESYPARFLPLRVFKCRQMLMLVVPGVRNDQASLRRDD